MSIADQRAKLQAEAVERAVELEQELQTVLQQRAKLEGELERERKSRRDLEQRVEAQERALAVADRNAAEHYASEVESLEHLIAAKNAQIAALESRFREQETTLATLRADLDSELAISRQREQQARDEVQKVNAAREGELQAVERAKRQEIEAVTRDAARRVAEAESAGRADHDRYQEAQQTITRLEQRLQENPEADSLRVELAETQQALLLERKRVLEADDYRRAEHDRHQSESAEWQGKVESLMAVLQSERVKSADELERVRAEAAAANADADTAAILARREQEHAAALAAAREGARVEIQRVQAEADESIRDARNAAADEIARIEAKAHAERATIEREHKIAIREAARGLADAAERARDAEKVSDGARGLAETLRQRVGEAEAALQVTTVERDSVVADLQQRLQEAESVAERASRERDSALAQIDVAETARSEAEHALGVEMERSVNLERRLAVSGRRASERIEQVRADLLGQVEEVQGEIAPLRVEMQRAETRATKAETALTAERAERRRVEQEHASANQRIAKLETDLQDERDAHTRTRNALEDRIRV